MSWNCSLYAEEKADLNATDDWRQIGTGPLYTFVEWLLQSVDGDRDGDPCLIDWMEEIKHSDLSESLKERFNEAPDQDFYMTCAPSDIYDRCKEVKEAYKTQLLAVYKALGIKCSLADGDLDLSEEFDRIEPQRMTFSIGKELMFDLNRKLSLYEKSLILRGVIDSIVSASTVGREVRLIFVRSR